MDAEKVDVSMISGITDGAFLKQLCNLSRKKLPEGFPDSCGLQEALTLWMRANIPEEQQSLFEESMSVAALEKSFALGKSSASFDYSDLQNPELKHRLTVRFIKDDETGDLLCIAGITDIHEEPGPSSRENSTSISPEAMRSTVRAAMADLQVEMELERKDVRRKHRKTVVILSVLMLLIGVAAGAFLDQKSAVVSEFVSHFIPQEAATPEPTAEIPVPETVEEPKIEEEHAAFGEPVTFTAEMLENGTARMNTSSDDYESIVFTARVSEVLDSSYFETYAVKKGYEMDGTEAGVHLELSFEDPGDSPSVIPQDLFVIRVLDSDGNILPGYQLVDQPFGGSYGKALNAGEKGNYYKRYEFSENAESLLLIYYVDGIQHNLYFALQKES